MRWLCKFVLACLAMSMTTMAWSVTASGDGKLLGDYLSELNQSGMSVIYSSDLVTSEMRLTEEPAVSPTLSELTALLRQFGLQAQPGPADSFLIIKVPTSSADVPSQVGKSVEPEIPEIIVTSSLHRIEYSRTADHTYIDRDFVDRVPTTGEDAVRVVSRLPGTVSSGVSAQSHIRGGERSEVLFMFDGLRLYEPYHLKDFQSVATIINSTAIGGVDFYSGAFPAHYGDRMSGVLNMEMREAQESVETELSLSFFNASALSLGRFGGTEQGDWLVSARRGNLDLVFDLVDPELGSPDYQDYIGHVGWDFGARAQLSANVIVSKDKLKLADTDRGERASATYSNQVGWITWSADWSEDLTSDTVFASSDISNRRQGNINIPNIVSGDLLEQKEFHVLEVRQDWRWLPANSWMLQFGFNMKRLDADYRFLSTRTIEAPFDAIFENEPQTNRNLLVDASGAQYAAYGELRWRPTDRLTLDVGARWDQQTYTTSNDDRQLSPRVSLLYEPTARTEVRVGWGKYFQAQEINELQVSDGVVDFFPAQKAEHVVLNLQHDYGTGLRLNTSIYQKKYSRVQPRFENALNSLTLLPELQFDRILINPSGAEAVGAEIQLRRNLTADDVMWWVGYTWSEVLDTLATGEELRGWDQTHTIKGGISWTNKRWTIAAAAEWHSGWPGTFLSGNVVPLTGGGSSLLLDVSDRNISRFSNFVSLDVRTTYQFDVPRGDLTIFLDVTNATNHSNTCCIEYSLATDGRLSQREKHWLPLLPSLGVVWHF